MKPYRGAFGALVLLVLLYALPVQAAVHSMSPADLAATHALGSTVSASFVDTPLTDVIAQIQTQLHVSFVIDPACLRDGEKPITLQLRDVPARDALDLIAQMTDLAYAVRSGAIVITTPARAQASAKPDLRIYDVRDFLAVASVGSGATGTGATAAATSIGTTSTTGTSGTLGTGNTGATNTTNTNAANRTAALQNLLTLIVEITGPENWRTAAVLGGATTGNEESTPYGGSF